MAGSLPLYSSSKGAYRTGSTGQAGARMKNAELARFSPRDQEFIRAELEKRSTHKRAPVFLHSPRDDQYDSDAERRYAQLLQALAGSGAKHWDGAKVLGWVHHPMKFRVGTNRWYTPDFALRLYPGPEWVPEATFRLVEVKGSWKSKNARESRAKLEAAALLNDWFEWEAATVNGPGFDHEVIGCR